MKRTGGAAGWGAVMLVLGLLAIPTALTGQVPDTLRPVIVDSVVVEVLRAPVPLDQAPFAVSVLGEEALGRAKAGASLSEALQGLPGVQVQNRFNYAVGERLSIRGFGARAQFGVRGSEVVVDGIPATLADGQSTLDHVDIGSLGAVEVLRGPASALYGNSAGGVLRFRSSMPPGPPFRQAVEAVLGSDGLRRYQSHTGGSQGDTRFALSLARLEFDGFRTNPLNVGGDTYGEAARHHANARMVTPLSGGELKAVLNVLDLDAENPGSLSDSLFALGGRQAFGFNVRQGTGKEVQQYQAGVTWTGPLAGIRAELATWGVVRSLDNPIPPAIINVDRLAGGIRGIVSSPDVNRRITWSLGAELEVQRDDRVNFENNEGVVGRLTLDQEERVTGLGVFGQLAVRASESLRFLGGLRYDRVDFEVEDFFPFTDDPDDSGERVLDQVSPSFGLTLDLASRAQLYANVSSFFETPTTTELANRPDGAGGFNPELDPQQGYSVEAGVRGRTGPGVRYEVVVFNTELDDELVPFEVPQVPGRTFFRNAGSSHRTGVEAAVSAPLGSVLDGRLTYSYVNARFDDFTVDGQDFADNRIPGLAPHRFEGLLSARWNGWLGQLRGEYVDDVPVNDAGTAAADAYFLLDFRVDAGQRRFGRLDARPFVGVTNLLDEEYSAAVTVNAFGGRFFEPGPGRSVYVGLRVGIEDRDR